jgi:tRNA G18 (ribose-2'-O)-methylase SpoU
VSAAPIRIDDPADPRLEPYCEMRERDLRGRGGRFVIEGEVVLRLATARSLYPIESVLLADNRVGLLETVSLPSSLPIYVAPRPVIDRVAGFPLHRGVVAIGRRALAPEPDVLLVALPPTALVVALSGISNHDNMGGIFRNAAAFGAAAVILDRSCCDPLYRKAIRVSAGAALVVPFAVADGLEPMCDALARAGFEVVATSPAGRESLSGLARGARMAALFGAEGHGLPASALERLRTVRIAMAPGFDSLNVATASGIVLHHLQAGTS